jgi:uncharacterized protein YhfF
MRDRLVAAALAGEKTATSSLVALYDLFGERLPRAGDQAVLVGSNGERLAVVETTAVELVELSEVSDEVAMAEGEGFRDAREWRVAHEAFWTSQLREAGCEPVIDDSAMVVVEVFRILRRL